MGCGSGSRAGNGAGGVTAGFGGAGASNAPPIDILPLNVAPSWMTSRATRTSPMRRPERARTRRLRAKPGPVRWPRTFTSPPDTDAVTFAMSSISTSPVTSTSPSTTPPTRRSPSMYTCPITRSRGPSVTEFFGVGAEGGDFGGSSAGTGVGRLATGLVLKVAHPDVAVEAGAVLDLQPARLHVSAQLCRLAQEKLVAGRQLTLELTFDRDVGALEQGLHDRAGPDLDVAADSKLAFGSTAALDCHVAAIRQLDLEAVVGAERDSLEPIPLA